MFILVDKPQWCTSHDIVDKIRRLYREEKVGHGGTLDPAATWLLVVAVGKDTKKLDMLLWAPKTYITTVDFSVSTDTWDLEYWKEYTQWPVYHNPDAIEVSWNKIIFPSIKQFHHQLTSLLGTHDIPLTPFSAKKIDGKKLYTYAREGNPIFMDVPMTVHAFHILDYTFPQLTIEIEVWSGTYIRSIGYRLGKQFGLWGTLSMLRRTKVGALSVPTEK
jgi:tRNA pseudouridine55 synthase